MVMLSTFDFERERSREEGGGRGGASGQTQRREEESAASNSKRVRGTSYTINMSGQGLL